MNVGGKSVNINVILYRNQYTTYVLNKYNILNKNDYHSNERCIK